MTLVPDAVLELAAHRFALLGDPTRLRLIRVLHECGECSVRDISDRAGTTLPNASQHLSRLLVGGLVKKRRVGKSVLYSLADETVESLCDIVCASVQGRARLMLG
ncbi:MAG: ArsR/SmtB family transcription factor [Actinomycetota bacterium]